MHCLLFLKNTNLKRYVLHLYTAHCGLTSTYEIHVHQLPQKLQSEYEVLLS